MLNCPFCGSDYGEVGLQQGRCRSCGSVIAWEEDGHDDELTPSGSTTSDASEGAIASPPETAAAATEPPDSNPSAHIHPAAEARPDVHGVDPSAESPATVGDATVSDAAKVGSGTESKSKDPLSSSQKKQLDAVWGATIQPAMGALMTIRGTNAPGCSDTKLVIQTRALRDLPDRTRQLPLQERADYELLEVIGEGGMGIVYAARQASIDRTVAIKMLHAANTENQEQRIKFLSEAVVTGELEHPNIVPIYDLGSNHDGALFYCMKRVKGTPWSSNIKAKSERENLDILMKVADAIAFAHSRGVVHRDIKPENVMLGDFGEVMVLDWGIALPLEEKRAAAVAGVSGMGGTPAYMAPEMASGPLTRIGVRSDIYLLGAVLFEIITGVPPHPGRDAMKCIRNAAANVIHPVPENQSGKLMDIAKTALSTKTSDRYANVLEFQQAIRGFLAHSESIKVSQRAEERLALARQTDEYEDFAQAQFGFQQALEMWSGNKLAEAGFEKARLAYAECALAKEDFDLGLSLLDFSQPSHSKLIRNLSAGRAVRIQRQKRLRSLQVIALLMVGIILVGGAWFSRTLYISRGIAQQFAASAKASAEDAEAQALLASEQADRANQQADLANRQAELAKEQAERAGKEALRANEEAQRALRSDYRKTIGLVSQRILENEFTQAEQLLNEARPKRRHFEWGRLKFITHPGTDFTNSTAKPSGRILRVATSGDGGLVIAARDDGMACVWRSDRPNQIWLKLPHDRLPHDQLQDVAISPDGEWAATAGGDESHGVVKLWRLGGPTTSETPAVGGGPASLTEDETFLPHEAAVLSVRFWSDSRRLLTTSADGMAKVWQWSSGGLLEPIAVFQGHLDQVRSADVSPDRRWVATASDDGTVRLWQTPPRLLSSQPDSIAGPVQGTLSAEVQRFRGHDGPVLSVAFKPLYRAGDEPWIASAGADQRVLLWKAQVEAIDAAAQSNGVQPGDIFEQLLAADLQRRLQGVGGRGDSQSNVAADRLTAELQEFSRPTDVVAFTGHLRGVQCVCFSQDGESLASAGKDHTIKIWTVREHPFGELSSMVEAADRNCVFHIADENLLSKTLSGHGSTVTSLVFLPEPFGPGNNEAKPIEILSGSFDGKVKLWNVTENDTRRVYAPLPTDADAAETGEAVAKAAAAAISEDSRIVVVGYDDGTARLFDANSRSMLTLLSEGHDFLTNAARYFDDGQRLLTIAGDNTVRVWNAQTGTEERRLPETGYRAVAALSPSEQYLATGTNRNTLAIWRVGPWDRRELLKAEVDLWRAKLQKSPAESSEAFEQRVNEMTPEVSAIAFSKDDRFVFVGDTSGKCRICELDSGRVVEELQGHTLTVNQATVADSDRDGELFFTASFDGRVIGWRLDRTQEKLKAEETLVHPGPITAFHVAPSNKGLYIFTACPGPSQGSDASEPLVQLRVWRWGERTPIREATISADQVSAMDVLRKGEQWEVLLTTASRSTSQLLLWTVAMDSSTEQDSAPRPLWKGAGRGLISSAIFGPQGDQVLTVGGKGARSWDFATGRKVLSFRQHGAISAVGFLPSGLQVAAPIDADSQPRLVPDPSAAPEDRLVFTAGSDQSVKIWSYQEGETTLQPQARWKLEGGDIQDGLRRGHSARINSACAARVGEELFLLTSSDDKTARVWRQQQDGRWVVMRIYGGDKGHSDGVNSALFSPDGRRVLTVSKDRKGLVWSFTPGLAREGRLPEETEPNHELLTNVGGGAILCADFSSDGRWIATGSNDAIVRLWDLTDLPVGSPALLKGELRGHSDAVNGVAFSVDRQRLVTASADGFCKVWDTHAPLDPELQERSSLRDQAFTELLDVEASGPEFASVAFASDGKSVITAGANGNTYLMESDEIPPSLRVSAGLTDFVFGQQPQVAVDPHLSIFAPSARLDYSGWKLEIRLESNEEASSLLPQESIRLELRVDHNAFPRRRRSRRSERLLRSDFRRRGIDGRDSERRKRVSHRLRIDRPNIGPGVGIAAARSAIPPCRSQQRKRWLSHGALHVAAQRRERRVNDDHGKSIRGEDACLKWTDRDPVH